MLTWLEKDTTGLIIAVETHHCSTSTDTLGEGERREGGRRKREGEREEEREREERERKGEREKEKERRRGRRGGERKGGRNTIITRTSTCGLDPTKSDYTYNSASITSY